MLKKYLSNMYVNAESVNTSNVIRAIKDAGPHPVLLDVGCWDGIVSQNWIKAARAKKVYGIEPVKKAAALAKQKKITVFTIQADRDNWPLKDDSVDCVISNQVVEHLSDLDHFFSEASRVLKKNGILVTSTNNLSSWHNIFSLILGWTPFDLSNSSRKKLGIGNPLAVHNGQTDSRGGTWTHKTIYTANWLFAWQEIYGLKRIKLFGAGYYPLLASLGNIFKTHSAFITTVCQKRA